MTDWLALAVALPLLGSVAAAAAPRRAGATSIACALLTTGVALFAAFLVARGVELRSEPGGWGAPLGITLRADGLSAVLLAMANLVSLSISVYALDYFPARKRRHFIDGRQLVVNDTGKGCFRFLSKWNPGIYNQLLALQEGDEENIKLA